MAAGPALLAQITGISAAGIRLVCLDRIPERVEVDSVSVEDVSAAELGVDHLIAMGHRRIAAVTGPVSLRNERQRLLGYEQSLQRAGLPLDGSLILHSNLRPEDVAAMCRGQLSAARP